MFVAVQVRVREAEEMKRMEMNTINLKNFVVQFQDPVLLAQDGLNVNNNSADVGQCQTPSATRVTVTDVDLSVTIKF